MVLVKFLMSKLGGVSYSEHLLQQEHDVYQELENLTFSRSCGCIICVNAKIHPGESIILKKVGNVVRISDASVCTLQSCTEKKFFFQLSKMDISDKSHKLKTRLNIRGFTQRN